ncbi:hypothetical protein [Bacillus salipaludis]|uniref:Uncharacterized protein n=1 Tax=Bacillus salipaludis TaxID=2547811 RepID=A0AA90TWL9_9BACI|nr:hypothetical protein [Bacillus salipaludis]MDQ6600844.1 hypothetical protein [Bacillus salipaludis]
MLFGTGILLAAGTTIGIALVVVKVCHELGIHWLGTAMKRVIHNVGFALAFILLKLIHY